MSQASDPNIEAYLIQVPDNRRQVLVGLRQLILENLPEGYEEIFNGTTFYYVIPLSRFPKTYNRQPLTYLALAAQKNYFSLYLMAAYGNKDKEIFLREEFQKSGKKIDMGKSCLHIKKLDDIPMTVLGSFIASITPEQFIERYNTFQKQRGRL